MGRNLQENPSEKTAYQREWLSSEKGLEYKKKHAEYAREWRKKNKEKFKATQKKAYDTIRLDILRHYSGKDVPDCKCCGENEILFLHIDHTDGNGAAHRRELEQELGYYPGGNGLPYWLKKNNYPEGFQILCANCNLAKRVNNTCPHQLRK
jgi:hypothetical protein